jgi:hypothetical protein
MMKIKRYIHIAVGIFSLILIYGVFASANNIRESNGEVWKNNMMTGLTAGLCKKGNPFLTTYHFTEETCVSSLRAEFVNCEKEIKIPSKIDPLNKGFTLSRDMGRCITEKIDKKYKK